MNDVRSSRILTEPGNGGRPTGVGASVDSALGPVAVWLNLDPARGFGAGDKTLLSMLCGSMAQALHRAYAYDQQREVAVTLQRPILGPVALPAGFAARYQPASRPLEVGGDWYDAVELPDGRIGARPVRRRCAPSSTPTETWSTAAPAIHRRCSLRIMHEMTDSGGGTDDVALLIYRHPAPLDVSFVAEPGELAPARAALRTWLERTGAGTAMVRSVLVAAGEACANAIEHGYRDTRGQVRLVARVVGELVHITVTDTGRWRPEAADPDPYRGHGLNLMRALMNQVKLNTDANGTTVEMSARITQ